MIRNHDDYSIMIQLFIDDELKGQEMEDLIFHLKDCFSCRGELEEEKAFSARVRDARPQVEAPPALRERILSGMSHSTNRMSSNAPKQKRYAVQSYWNSLAVAVMFLIAVGGIFTISYYRQRARANSFIDAAVAEHRRADNDRPLDVRSSSPDVVTAWFAQRVSFPFRMPNAGIAADDRGKYTLAGGRLVKFGGGPAALLEFRMPNSRISLLVASDKLATAVGGKVTHSDGLSFHTKDLGDLHVATWNNKGLTYALISSVPMVNSRSCSTCHKDSSIASAFLRNSRKRFWRGQPLPEMSANQVHHFQY